MTGEPEKEIRAGTASVGMYVRGEGGAWEQRMNGATWMLERGEEVRDCRRILQIIFADASMRSQRHWDFSHVVSSFRQASLADCIHARPCPDPINSPASSSQVECVEEYGALDDDTEDPFMANLYDEPLSADLFSPPEGLLAQ